MELYLTFESFLLPTSSQPLVLLFDFANRKLYQAKCNRALGEGLCRNHTQTLNHFEHYRFSTSTCPGDGWARYSHYSTPRMEIIATKSAILD